MSAQRITCCITGCVRTAANPEGWTHWICAKHWPMAPRFWRRRVSVLRRIARNPNDPRNARAAELFEKLWNRCRLAIEDVAAGRAVDPNLADFLERL